MNYIDTINKEIKSYFDILEPDFPEWLNEYINTESLLKQQYISVTCGTIYTDLFPTNLFYSSLDHSIAVALVIWHFTHDKKATLSGLFHDIATPVFKHSVDFMNGDYMNQESTEEETKSIIEHDQKIMELLKRDSITVDEVYDYKIYPVADNDTPKLSADRLEYSLSNSLIVYKITDLETIKKIYENITVETNEEGITELAFNGIDEVDEFVRITSLLSVIYREDRTRYSMQLLADILANLSKDGLIFKQDLYNMKESEVIELIENSKYKEQFALWKSTKEISSSEEEPVNTYFVHHPSKIRYINPLVKTNNELKRANEVSDKSRGYIEDNLAYNMDSYVYIPGLSLSENLDEIYIKLKSEVEELTVSEAKEIVIKKLVSISDLLKRIQIIKNIEDTEIEEEQHRLKK